LGGNTLNFVPAALSPTVGNFFIGSTGNIGLGTLTPTSRFQVNSGDVSINSGKLLLGTVANFNDSGYGWGIKSDKPFVIANSTFPLIELRSTSPTAYGWADFAVATGDYYFSDKAKKGDVVLRGYTTGSLIFTNDALGDIKFATKADNVAGTTTKIQLIIDKNGNIGMGTETPDAKLAVNGLIHTKEVKVDLLGWPDYVFKKDFQLPSLKQVEDQIIKEGHLKDIPSAKEVETDGVKLGEMNKLLLQKVEELTLYIIEMNKELQQVKSQLK
jgi:hypothetical protein